MPMDLERYQALVAATSKKPKRDPEEISPFDLPGLTRPLDWEGNGGLFPTALTENFVLKLTALREFEMLRLMDAITDKEGWEKKVHPSFLFIILPLSMDI